MASPGEIEKLERRWLENMTGLTFAPLAEAYRKAGRLDEAFQTLELGLAHHPDYVPAYIVRGRCGLDAGDDAAAATAFALVLSFDSLNLIALRGLAEISLRSGRPQEAILHLRRLLDVDRTDVEAANRLAELQAAVAPAPRADYAPAPMPREEPPLEAASLSDATDFPLMDLGDAESPPEATEDLAPFALPDAGPPDPIDLRIDERWSSPGATSEFALSNDSETLAAPSEAAGSSDALPEDADLELDAPEISFPPLDVVPTLRDLSEDAPDTADAGEPMAFLLEEAEDSSFEDPFSNEVVETESESGESVVASDEPTEPLLSILGTEADVPANPWAPAELRSPDLGEEDSSVHVDVSSAGMEPAGAGADVAADPVEVSIDAVDPTEGIVEEIDDEPPGFPPRWTVAGSEADLALDLVASEEGAEAATGWMSNEDDRDETPASAPMDMSDGIEESDRIEESEESDGSLVVTESMAEIFLRQGHDELALAVYTELARRDPDDFRLQEAITRLTPTAAAEVTPSETPTPSVAGRFAASNTGGESLGDFLAAVLAVREPTSPTAITPPAMDRPREGEPTRPADTHFGLNSVFGDDSTDASMPSATAGQGEGEGSSPSFDEFFGERPPVVAPPSSGSPASDSEDLQHFNDWLKGLKR